MLRRKGLALRPEGAKRIHPQESRVEINDGSSLAQKYFLRKIRHGQSETFYGNLVLDVLGIKKLKDIDLEAGRRVRLSTRGREIS